MNKLFHLLIFIISLLAATKWFFTKPRVLVYSPDIVGTIEYFDPRVRGLLAVLKETNTQFGELLHTIPGKRFLKNLMSRRRVAWYLEAGNFLPLVFQLVKPKQIWILDDLRYWHIIIKAAEHSGIPVYAFQHGRFYPGMPITGAMPTHWWVWNAYWRERLIALRSFFMAHADRIAIGGRSQTSEAISLPLHGDTVTLLMPYETAAKPSEIRRYIERLLELPHVRIIFKLRPDYSHETQILQYHLDEFKAGDRLRVVFNLQSHELTEVDAVLGTYSTMLYEMIEIGKPIGILEASTTQAEDLLSEHLAELVNLRDDIDMQISHLTSTSPDVLLRRAQKLRVDRDLKITLQKLLTLHG